MRMDGNLRSFDRLGLLCRNPTVPEAMRTFLCLHQQPNWVHAASGAMEPEFTDMVTPTKPVASSSGAQYIDEEADRPNESDLPTSDAMQEHICQFHPKVSREELSEDDDEDIHHHHLECQVCYNCVPRIEQDYYVGSDGEAFYYNHRVCQSTDPRFNTTRENNESCVNAMRTVHSSNVHRNSQLTNGQPR